MGGWGTPHCPPPAAAPPAVATGLAAEHTAGSPWVSLLSAVMQTSRRPRVLVKPGLPNQNREPERVREAADLWHVS